MKKTLLCISLSLLLALPLTSCRKEPGGTSRQSPAESSVSGIVSSSQPNDTNSSTMSTAPTTPPVVDPSTLVINTATGLELAPYSSISMYTGNLITYTTQCGDPVTGISDNKAFVYDKDSDTTQLLGQYEYDVASGDLIQMDNGKIYECPLIEETNKLVAIDPANKTITELLEIPMDYPLVRFAKISGTEFIYNVARGIDKRTLSFYRYNTESGENTLFLSMDYDNVQVKGITSFDVYRSGGRLHFLTTYYESKSTYYDTVDVYSLDGKKMESRKLPEHISHYINEYGELESPYKFSIHGDYAFFRTINRKVFMCRYQDGAFQEMPIPSDCQLLETLQVSQTLEDLRYVYFLEKKDLYAETMLVFDSHTGEFYRVKFQIDDAYHYVSGIYANEKNDLVVGCENNKNFDNTSKMFFVSQEDILKVMQPV